MSVLSAARVEGPLVVYRAGFEAELAALGYTELSATQQVRLLGHLSRWLADHDVEPAGLDREGVEAFLAERRAAGHIQWISWEGMRPLLPFLMAVGAVPAIGLPVDPSPAGEVLESFRRYLVEERGLVASSVSSYMAVARRFLAARSGPGGIDLGSLMAADVARFVVAECEAGGGKGVVTALRCLLRFLFLEGEVPTLLCGAVPAVAGWSGATLPKAAAPSDVAAVLASCDRGRPMGQRDFAVITVMARLGLRAGETAGLCLEDIDWRAGELVVRGKARRDERLPLPADVGEAIVAYLRQGRPRSRCRKVFLRARAPWVGLSQPAVTTIVYAACARAGVPRFGAHCLRHSAATEMLRNGAGLAEIAEVLRHHDPLTTSMYAKVDHASLRELAQPWPGAQQ